MATFFSIGISALTKLLPRHLHTGKYVLELLIDSPLIAVSPLGAIGLVTAMGQAGSASFPFCKSRSPHLLRAWVDADTQLGKVTGVLAQRFGPVALQPVIIVLLANMASVFFFIPSVTRRTE